MIKAIAMAYELEGCGAGNEAAEMRRLSAIEQAATALIKCKGRYHAEQNTKALATVLGIELPIHSGAASGKPIFWYRPYSNGEMCDGPIHDSVIEQVRKDSGAWVPLYEHPTNQSSAEDLLVRALAALEYHTQQTRPITESENVISALMAYLTNQCAEQAEDPARPSAIELQDAEIGIPVPVTEPVHANPFTYDYALARLVENVKVWGEFPATKIPYWEFFMFPDSMKVVLINIVNGVEITEQDWKDAQPGRDWKAAEVGIPEPFTPVINPCKEVSQA